MQQLFATMPSFRLAQRQRLENGENVLLDRHLAKDRFFLRQITHAEPGSFVHRIIRHIGSGENDAAAVWPNESDDHVKAGRLAGAIRPEQSDDFTGAHIDSIAVHDRAAAVNFHELLGDENLFCSDPGLFR